MNEKINECGGGKTVQERLNKALHRCGHYLHRHDTHPSQAAVLRLLHERGTMSQGEVGQSLGIRPGSVSELISKLEDRGTVARVKDESDKRRIMLTLTQKGREIGCAPVGEVLSKRYAALSEDEQKTLIRLLDRLFESWKAEEDEK